MPDVTIKASDGGEFSAYLSLPRAPKGKVPGIIMMQQIFGVNAEMRGFTDDFAAQGYVAICPDLYWRQQPGVQLMPGEPGAFDMARGYGAKFDTDKAVDDLKAAVGYLRTHPLCDGKIGTVGYCLGGLLAYLMAARSDAQCNVGYFGVRIEKYIAEAAKVAHPLMLHIPEADRYVPPAAQAIIIAGLEGKAVLHRYPDADHAFNRVGAASYNAAVTALAYDRTASFLKRHLG
jgi:carboxymethylenebutenolidase